MILYNLLLCFSYMLLFLTWPFNKKIRLWIKGQNGNIKRIKAAMKDNESPVVWMHCSSLGEFEQGRPLLEAFRKNHPQFKAIVSFFSPSGYNACKNYKGADYICYLPLDTSTNAKKIIEAINPQIVFWIRYEFWANHLNVLKQKNVPVYLISATFRKNQVFFKNYGYFFKCVLKKFKHIFVQNTESEKILKAANIFNVTTTGDTRFDRVIEVAARKTSFPIIENFVEGSQQVLIAGSSWPKDEKVLADTIRNLPNMKLIIVPHEIDEDHISEIEKLFDFRKTIRYTQAESTANYDVLILNTMGMLSSVYRYADIAFIGCGFDDGIHNIAEAAVYGIPVTFGPNFSKFEEANDLVKLEGAIPINNAEELTELIELWLTDNELREKAGNICAKYITENSGTTQKILNVINHQI